PSFTGTSTTNPTTARASYGRVTLSITDRELEAACRFRWRIWTAMATSTSPSGAKAASFYSRTSPKDTEGRTHERETIETHVHHGGGGFSAAAAATGKGRK